MSKRHCECAQSSVAVTLVLPGNKPDIERILRVTSTPVIEKSAVIEKKVVFSGHIDVLVEYVGCVREHTQPVHFASFKAPVSHFIEHRSARPDLEARLGARIEHQEFDVIDRRTVIGTLILKVCILRLEAAKHLAKSCTTFTHSAACGAKDPACSKKPPICEASDCQTCSCVVIDC